jgi:hypothetical protein
MCVYDIDELRLVNNTSTTIPTMDDTNIERGWQYTSRLAISSMVDDAINMERPTTSTTTSSGGGGGGGSSSSSTSTSSRGNTVRVQTPHSPTHHNLTVTVTSTPSDSITSSNSTATTVDDTADMKERRQSREVTFLSFAFVIIALPPVGIVNSSGVLHVSLI